ncbi:tpr repeat containing protein [Anaeramoeba flamelloides]|uniref:Tpr repeat containing protein n=1 Tax=Anaeramoeba flamelloides TaxID=1746091 RepID=A0AAV8A1P1_9EUKA|nr:tpr repeat containing protein [Anaeramoeba flamelloides]
MDFGNLKLKIYGARGLQAPNSQKKISTYLTVQTDTSISRTNVVETISQPKWKNYMSLKIENPLTIVVFKIMCHNPNGEDTFLKRYDLNLYDLFKLTSENSKNFLCLPMTWFSLNSNPFGNTIFRSNSFMSGLLLEIFFEIPGSWFKIYEGYQQFIEGNYDGCISTMTHTLDVIKPKKTFIFYLLRSFSYFHQEKYELSLRDCTFINLELKKNAEAFYRMASIQYLICDFESAKTSIKTASQYSSLNQNLGSGQLKLDIQELETKISKSEKKIKESEIDLFIIQCKDMYFDLNVVKNYQSLLAEEITKKSASHLFNNENINEPVVANNFEDKEDNGEFSQNFVEIFKKKLYLKENNVNILEKTGSLSSLKNNGNEELTKKIIEETTTERLNFFN